MVLNAIRFIKLGGERIDPESNWIEPRHDSFDPDSNWIEPRIGCFRPRADSIDPEAIRMNLVIWGPMQYTPVFSTSIREMARTLERKTLSSAAPPKSTIAGPRPI